MGQVCSMRQFNVEGHVSDMTALPWKDETFDAVLSISAIHHHHRREIVRAFGEVRRVLKPGGLPLADLPCTTDYRLMRTQDSAGLIAEVSPTPLWIDALAWRKRMMASCRITLRRSRLAICWVLSKSSGCGPHCGYPKTGLGRGASGSLRRVSSRLPPGVLGQVATSETATTIYHSHPACQVAKQFCNIEAATRQAVYGSQQKRRRTANGRKWKRSTTAGIHGMQR